MYIQSDTKIDCYEEIGYDGRRFGVLLFLKRVSLARFGDGRASYRGARVDLAPFLKCENTGGRERERQRE